jgi:hypothetical protein
MCLRWNIEGCFIKENALDLLLPPRFGLARRRFLILFFLSRLFSLVISLRLHPGTCSKPNSGWGNELHRQASLKGNIYHPQSYGDYLIWRLWPGQRSFFDGRVHLFDESLVKFYFQVMSDSHWEEMLEKYQVKYLLLPKGKIGSEEMKMVDKARKSKYWRPLYEDSISALFEKSH